MPITAATGVAFANDLFTDTAATYLENHVANSGGAWAARSGTHVAAISSAGRVYPLAGATTRIFSLSDVPISADYDVRGTIYQASSALGARWGMLGRYSPTGGHNGYLAWWVSNSASNALVTLAKYVNGVASILGQTAALAGYVIAPGTSKVLELRMRGTTIEAWFDGVLIWSFTDTSHAAAGLTGCYTGATMTATTGPQLDTFTAQDTTAQSSVAPSQGIWVG